MSANRAHEALPGPSVVASESEPLGGGPVPGAKRKQLSGAAKRRRARAKLAATGIVMPPAPTVAELASLTGTMRESAKNYIRWRRGVLSRDDYLVSVRGIEGHKAVLLALEAERQRIELEQLNAKVEAANAASGITPMIAYAAPDGAGAALDATPLPVHQANGEGGQ